MIENWNWDWEWKTFYQFSRSIGGNVKHWYLNFECTLKILKKDFQALITLHGKRNFPLRISSVNVSSSGEFLLIILKVIWLIVFVNQGWIVNQDKLNPFLPNFPFWVPCKHLIIKDFQGNRKGTLERNTEAVVQRCSVKKVFLKIL